MSNIPSSAVTAAFLPVQQSTNDLIRARQVQSQKNSRHSEDVEELDDTAVNSVRDQNQRKGGDGAGDGHPQRQEGENVEIEALREIQTPAGGAIAAQDGASGLDISA